MQSVSFAWYYTSPQCDICYSNRELGRGDREVWGAIGGNQIGIIHSAAMPVKYSYDTVLENAANNEQVWLQSCILDRSQSMHTANSTCTQYCAHADFC